MATLSRVSLDEFLAIPDFDERRLELLDGEVVEKPWRTWGHATTVGRLAAAFGATAHASVSPRAIIPASPTLAASSPVADFAFYRDNPPAGDEWMLRPPHVAAEVVADRQSRREMRLKVDLYVAFGVESVWIVDPRTQTVDVYEGGARRTFAGDDVLETSAVPGFSLPLRELFGRGRG